MHPVPTQEAPVSLFGEAVEVYCDTLAEKAEPLRVQAKEARTACAKLAADAKLGDGWWVPVCQP